MYKNEKNRTESILNMEKETKKMQASNVLEGMTSISALLNSTCGNNRTIERVWIDSSKRKSKAATREVIIMLFSEKYAMPPVLHTQKISKNAWQK